MELIDKAKLYDEISRLEKMAMDNANEKEQNLQAYLININSLNERTMMKYLVADFPTVEPPKGEWKISDDMYETFVCNVCGYDTEDYIPYNFCPHCGCDMRKKV